jgi:hypothetical protein
MGNVVVGSHRMFVGKTLPPLANLIGGRYDKGKGNYQGYEAKIEKKTKISKTLQRSINKPLANEPKLAPLFNCIWTMQKIINQP